MKKLTGGKKTELDGVWIRKGTINYVNNVAVDTVFQMMTKKFSS